LLETGLRPLHTTRRLKGSVSMNRTIASALRIVLNVTLVTLLFSLGLSAQGRGQGQGQGGQPNKVTLIVKTAKGASKADVDGVVNGQGGSRKNSVDKLDLHVIEVPEQAAAAISANLK